MNKDTPQNIFSSASSWRENIREKAVESLKTAFPFTGKKYTVQVENVRVKPEEYGPTDFKKAMMTARTLSEPIKGTLILKDAAGTTLQKLPDFTLAQLPYYTPHHTFLIEGTPHAVNSQLRMKPGVYTRKKRNEELEAQFNTIGNPFRMTMDPESGHFHLEYQTSKIPLYPILNKLGVSDKEMSANWNPKLVEANRNKFAKIDQHFDKLYSKIVRPSEESTDKVEAVNKAFARTQLDPDVTKELLGKSFTHVTPQALLSASQKLLRAYNDKQDFDERDNLSYKRIMGVDDFIAERIKLDARDLKRKVMLKLDYGQPDLEKAIPTSPFTRGIRKFLSTSALSGSPTQINPLELMDAATKVTSMGEGGISSDRAVPTEARHLHGSHLGVLDPVRTPESYRAGIELRTSLFTSRDKQGNIYTALTDRAGKTKYVSVSEATKKAIAFPNQNLKGKDKIDVMQAGKLRSVHAAQVDYSVPNVHGMYTVSTNLIPFLNSIDGNRAEMGSKMVTQALPLKDPEPPLVQVASYRPGLSMEEEIARKVVPTAKTHGVVDKIKDGFIYIKSKGAKTAAVERVPFFENYPLATKTYLHDTLRVKAGDEVKPGQALADSIFVRDGQLALGKNLKVAYAPFRGMNTNDAIVVSDSAAKKLTSLHMYREGLDVERDMRTGRDVHKSYFGNKFSKAHYDVLDDDGLIKPGTKVTPGDPLIVAVRKSPLSADAKMLGKLHKSLVNPYRDASIIWEHDTPGVITDVARTGSKIRLTVKTEEPLRIGDKLANRYGAKGVVSMIVPDDQMLQDTDGKPIDVAITPAGVISRLNPAQILEAAVAKVAQKTGKPIHIENFAPRDNLQWVKDQLKKHGLSDTETLVDPATGKKLKNVLVGPQYTYKLMKTTETNYSARGLGDGDYDVNQQPGTGGPTGSKGMGRLEFNALVAHDARNILKEIATLKSQRNDEWWRAHQLGLPAPALKSTFAYDKFGAMLSGAGIKMSKEGNHIALGPLTDKDVTKMSAGAIKRPLFVKAKDLSPEHGGFFDPVVTGGLNGTKWSHVDLTEPVVNPVFERPVKTFLGMTQSEFEKTLKAEGGSGIRNRLSKIDLGQREKDVMAELTSTRADKRDNLVKELKYLRALNSAGMRPEDAYITSKIPVVPPIYRPIVPGKTGDLQISDANSLLRDAMIANDLLSKTQGLPGVHEDARKHLYESVGALYGVRDPVSPQLLARNAQGYIARIAGVGSPKSGFFQSKLVKRQQDVSGRGTIVPDSTLAMDEVGLPEDAGWSMFSPFVIKSLVQRGYGATDARKMVEDRHPVAKETLLAETRNRPVLINRAPSLYRYNVLAAYPKLVPGKTIRVPEALAPIQSGDYDGDAVTIMAPVTAAAVEEARGLTLPNMLLSDQRKFTLTKAAPQQEAVLGIYKATSGKASGKAQTFETKGDALDAYHRGDITLNTPVTIKRHTTKLSSEMGILNWCGDPDAR